MCFSFFVLFSKQCLLLFRVDFKWVRMYFYALLLKSQIINMWKHTFGCHFVNLNKHNSNLAKLNENRECVCVCGGCVRTWTSFSFLHLSMTQLNECWHCFYPPVLFFFVRLCLCGSHTHTPFLTLPIKFPVGKEKYSRKFSVRPIKWTIKTYVFFFYATLFPRAASC